MKKIEKFALFILLAAPPVTAYGQSGELLRSIADKTAPEISSPFSAGLLDATFSVPEPVSPFKAPVPAAPGRGSLEALNTDYQPLDKKAVYEYDYTSSEFPGSKLIRVEYYDYSPKDNVANVAITVFNRPDSGNNKVRAYTVYANSTGVYASASPMGGKRIEFPLPVAVGKTWTEGADTHRITTMNGRISVPAGSYSGCLKVLARLGGGDTGTSERLYAPGVGLVYESVAAEDTQKTIKLISYQSK